MVENSTSDIVSEIRQALETNFTTHALRIIDQSGGCGQSLQVVVVSDDFKDVKLLDRQ